MPRNPRSSIDSSFLHIMVQGVNISNNSTEYLFIDNDKHNSNDISKYMNIRYLSFSKHSK